jgi:hypothetical protein
MGTAPLWEHEVALAITAIPTLRLADFAPTIRLVVPQRPHSQAALPAGYAAA